MAEKKRGRPAHVEVTCAWKHVWTSKGRIEKGQKINVPPEEAKALKEQGSCK